MSLRAAPPTLPAPTYTFPVPMHATVELEVSAGPEGTRAPAERNDGRSVRVARDTAHKPLAGGKAQLVREPMGSVGMAQSCTLFRLPRKSELVLEPILAPPQAANPKAAKDGAPVPCHVTAVDTVEVQETWFGLSRATNRRWRLTCEPVTRPKGRKDAGPWYVFIALR